MILTLTSRKGGCGKSVLAMIITASLAAEGTNVGLVDTDPNGSAYRWATGIHVGPTIHAYVEADADRLADLLPQLIEQHAVVVVDTAGFGNQAATVAAAAADLVLVPVTPGEPDVIEAQRTVGQVTGLARITRRPIPVRVVINRARRKTALFRHIGAELDRMALPRLTTSISDAVAFGEMSFSGSLPATGNPASDVVALREELRELGLSS